MILRPHLILLIIVMLAILVTGLFFVASKRGQGDVLRLAAGSRRSESFKLAEAISKVGARHLEGLRIEVIETAGSAASMAALDAGQVHAILAQADAKPCPPARLVARMFPEDFQLIVHNDSGINRIADLKKRRVGLSSKGSGQYNSFWFVADHYGIEHGDLIETTGSDDMIDELFMKKEVDAIFRVRPPQNDAIRRLVRAGNGQIVLIEQTGALGLKLSAIEPSTIPKGAYQGAPPIPATDLPTVSAPRLLFAAEGYSAENVRRLTSLLYEYRFDLVELMPLASFISPPPGDRPSLVPLHPGARAYYDREKPNFFQENADFVALILTVLLLLASWLWGLKRLLERRRKDRADKHNLELASLMQNAAAATSLGDLEAIRTQLVQTFNEVVRELDTGRIDSDSLQSFSMVWNAAAQTARDREAALRLLA